MRVRTVATLVVATWLSVTLAVSQDKFEGEQRHDFSGKGALDITTLLQTASRVQTDGGFFGIFGSSNTENAKFGKCVPSKEKPVIPTPKALEDRIRSGWKVFADAGPVAIGANKILLEIVDASFLYHNQGDDTTLIFQEKLENGDGVAPTFPRRPQSCEDMPKASARLVVEDLIIAFKEAASSFDLSRSLTGDEITVRKATINLEVGVQAFGLYDVEASREAKRPIFEIRDREESNPLNDFSFCLGKMEAQNLEADSTLVRNAPTILSWFQSTISADIGKELKCFLRNNQPAIVDLIHAAAQPSKYWIGMEVHTRGAALQSAEHADIEFVGQTKVRFPTADLFDIVVRQARETLEMTRASKAELRKLEAKVLKGSEKVHMEEIVNYVRSAINEWIELYGYDETTALAVLDYIAERFEDPKTALDIVLARINFMVRNPYGVAEGAKGDFNVGQGLVRFIGGAGHFPLELALTKAEVKLRESCQRRYRTEAGTGKYREHMRKCLSGRDESTPMSSDELMRLLASEDYEMNIDTYADIKNFKLKGPLNERLFSAVENAACQAEDAGCRELVAMIGDYIMGNTASMALFTADARGGTSGIVVNKEVFAFNLGFEFNGSISISTIIALITNGQKFLRGQVEQAYKKHSEELMKERLRKGSSLSSLGSFDSADSGYDDDEPFEDAFSGMGDDEISQSHVPHAMKPTAPDEGWWKNKEFRKTPRDSAFHRAGNIRHDVVVERIDPRDRPMMPAEDTVVPL